MRVGKNISLNPSQLHTPTWILQNESQKVSPSFGIYVLYKEYSIEEHTKFKITGQKHFTLGVINPIWYTALRTPGLFFLRMTILNAETQDNFLGNCWQMILHPRNSTVTCRSTWPRQPLRWGNGIMIKPSALTPNASPLRDTGIWIYKASSSANIFLRGGDVFVGSWMNVCDMISTHVQANQRSTKLTCWEWGHVRTTEIGSPQKKEKGNEWFRFLVETWWILDDIKATKNFNDKMCDYISSHTPCRITLSVPTQAKPWKVCGPRPPNGADACRDPNQRPWPAVNHMNWRQVMVSWSNVQRFGE